MKNVISFLLYLPLFPFSIVVLLLRHLYPILFFFSLLSFTVVIEPNRSQVSLDFVVSTIQTRRADSIYCVIAMIAQLVLSVSIYSAS